MGDETPKARVLKKQVQRGKIMDIIAGVCLFLLFLGFVEAVRTIIVGIREQKRLSKVKVKAKLLEERRDK